MKDPNKLPMSLGDIVKSYQEAKDKKKQITIFAELNLCTREVIREVLVLGGVPPLSLPRTRKAPAEPVKEAESTPALEMSEVDLTQLEAAAEDLLKERERELHPDIKPRETEVKEARPGTTIIVQPGATAYIYINNWPDEHGEVET